MAISSYQVTLKWGDAAETLTKLCPIKDYPEVFGDPNTLETTTLDDKQQTFIPGIKTSDTMAFTANYDKDTAQELQTAEGKHKYFELDFSDGSKFTWEGSVSLGIPGKGVDEVVEMTINIVPSTVITLGEVSE